MSKKKANDRKDKLVRDEFREKLRKHLSDEYMRLNDKKLGLENEATHLKMEMNHKDKKLFPSMKKNDYRKYFSPLNLSESEDSGKNEIENKYELQMRHLTDEIDKIEESMEEIRYFLNNLDQMI